MKEKNGERDHNKGDLKGREEADLGVEERDGVGDLDDDVGAGGEASEEEAVDGGGFVL